MGFLGSLFKPNVQRLKAVRDYNGLFAALRHDDLYKAAEAALLEVLASAPLETLVAVLRGNDARARDVVYKQLDQNNTLGHAEDMLRDWHSREHPGTLEWCAAAKVFITLVVERALAGPAEVTTERQIKVLIKCMEDPMLYGPSNRPQVIAALQHITGQDFGPDSAARLRWLHEEWESGRSASSESAGKDAGDITPADYQWMKDDKGKVCGIWLRDERAARNGELLQQLIYRKFGLENGLALVTQLGSANILSNTGDSREGWFVLFETPVGTPD